MKKITLLLLLIAYSATGQILPNQPTKFNNGIAFPNATEQTSADRLAAMDSTGLLNGYILKDSLGKNFYDDYVIGRSDLNFVAYNFSKNNLSYNYVERIDANNMVFRYAYGDKMIVYVLGFNSSYNYLRLNAVYLSDIDVNGYEDIPTRQQIFGNVQEFAIRYRLNGTTDDDLWFPKHGVGSTDTQSEMAFIDIDGIIYEGIANIPLNEKLIFEKVVIKQEVESRYDALEVDSDIDVNLYTIFDSAQLHFSNIYNFNKDIDVNRFYGSRLSVNGSEGILTNTNSFFESDVSNTSTFYPIKPSSNIIKSPIVTGSNYVNGINENISFYKSFYDPENEITVFNRDNGEQTLYYNLSPFLENDNFTLIESGNEFESNNNIFFVPNSYSENDIDVELELSDGLKRKSRVLNPNDYLQKDVNETTSGNLAVRDFTASRDGLATIELIASDVVGAIIGTDTDHDVIFRRNNVEKLRLTADGVKIPDATADDEAVAYGQVFGDSGWQSVTLNGTNTSSGTIQCKKIGNTLIIKGSFQTVASMSGNIIATLPSGYRPDEIRYDMTSDTNSSNEIKRVMINTLGQISVLNPNNSGGYEIDVEITQNIAD